MQFLNFIRSTARCQHGCIPPCIDGHACRRCWSRLSNVGSLFYFYKKYTPDSCDTLVHSCTKICTDCYGLVDRRSRLQTREHTSTQNLAKKKCRNPITVNMAKLYKVQTSPDSYPTYSTATITDKDTKILVEALKLLVLVVTAGKLVDEVHLEG